MHYFQLECKEGKGFQINTSLKENLPCLILFNHCMFLWFFSVGGLKLGSLLIEGKTKQVFDLPEQPGHCLLLNKDRITAGDGVKAHDLEGKAAISNQTNAKVFEILKAASKNVVYFFTFLLCDLQKTKS